MTTGFQPLFSPAMNFYKFRVFFPTRYGIERTLLKEIIEKETQLRL